MNIANKGNIDLEYLRMMNHIENKVDLAELPANCDLRKGSGGLNNISLVELDSGTRLIVKDETEILIPKSMREAGPEK